MWAPLVNPKLHFMELNNNHSPKTDFKTCFFVVGGGGDDGSVVITYT